MKKGILIVVSGFSGAGKGTIIKELRKKYDYELSISATTRNPRKGDVDGVDYFFKTRDEFEEMIKKDKLIEWAKYVGNYYGTPREYVEQQLEAGKDVLLEIEMQGGMLVKKQYPDAMLLFITPPSAEILKNRLTGRGTETEEEIERRMNRAAEESDYMEKYDYILVNDSLDETVEELHHLIQSKHHKTVYCADLITTMKQQLNTLAGK